MASISQARLDEPRSNRRFMQIDRIAANNPLALVLPLDRAPVRLRLENHDLRYDALAKPADPLGLNVAVIGGEIDLITMLIQQEE